MNKISTLLLLVLLVKPVSGLGQQRPAPSLESLVAAAQQAQTSHDYAAAANAYAQAVKLQPATPELWANLGLMQQETGDIHAAILSYKQANRLNPSLYVPNLFLGIDYVRTGKAADAVPFLVKARRINAADAQVPLALGRAYLSLDNLSAAVRELSSAVSLNPKLGSAWFALGIAELNAVEEEARDLTDKDFDSAYVQALFAESLEKQFRYPEASEILRKVIGDKVQPPCMRSELGYSLLRQHDSSAAATEFSSELATHPECSLSMLGQARIAIDAGEDDNALDLLRRLWLRDPGFVCSNAIVLTEGLPANRAAGLVSALMQQHAVVPEDFIGELSAVFSDRSQAPVEGMAASSYAATPTAAASDHRTAEEYYAAGQFQRCATRLRESPAQLRVDQMQLLAACAFLTGDYKRSSSAAASALRQPHSMLAYYWSIKAQEKLASEAFNQFEILEPNSSRSHILLGDIYRQRLRFDAAAAEYKQALAITPDDPAALMGLASAYLSNNRIDQAIVTAHAALARVPNDPDVNLIMAAALVSEHHYAEAKPFLDKSLNAKPQMLPRMHALLGRVYAETGKIQEAIVELQMGESSDVDGSVHYQLARLYRQVGDNKSAARTLEQMRAIRQQRDEQKLIAVEDPDRTTSEAGP